MSKRLIESLSGIGTLHAGELFIRRIRYELSVVSDDTASDNPQGATIEGHIDITGIGEAAVLAGPDRLILTIEDGRRTAIQLTSSAGGIVGRNWLPPGSGLPAE
jgi:hypothetical protein